jgi:hypothetical protein
MVRKKVFVSGCFDILNSVYIHFMNIFSADKVDFPGYSNEE